MANISKINVGGVDINVKDTIARQELTNLSNEIPNIITSMIGNFLPLKGKKVAFYGTSISFGAIGTGRAVKPFPAVFGDLTGAIVTNNGINASNLAVTGNSELDANAFCNRVDTEDFSTYDYLFIEYGTNDHNNNIVMGSDGNSDKTTFHGAMQYSIIKLMQLYPKLKIIMLTPIYSATTYTRNTKNLCMLDYVKACIEVATRYCIPVIDLHNSLGVNSTNIYTLYSDHLIHPTEETYYRIGEYIANAFPGISHVSNTFMIWKPLTLLGGATGTLQYCIDSDLFIHFRGLVTTTTQTAFTQLPLDAIPTYQHILPIACQNNGNIIYCSISVAGAMFLGVASCQIDCSGLTPYYVGTPTII